MKKFFSILCALAIVLSASAVPAKTLVGSAKLSKDHFAKQQVEKASAKKVPAAKFSTAMPKQIPAMKAVQTTKRVAGEMKTASAVKFAPAAKLETYNVTIVSSEGTFWGYDVQYIMDDADGLFEFAFDILLPTGQEDVTLGQIYTLADMDAEYTWGGNPTTEQMFPDFSAVSFVKTMDAQGLVNITASVTDVEGNIYNLVYQEEPLPVATDTINVVFAAEDVTLSDYTSTSGIFQFKGWNANGAVYAAFYGSQIEGVYSNDDLYLNYTGIYQFSATDTTAIEVLAGDAVISFANDTFHLSAYYLGDDAHCYHVQMAYYQEPFVPTGDTINVAITEPMSYKYYSTDGDWWLRGENAEYAVSLDLVNNDATSPAGTYAKTDAIVSYTYVTDKATSTKLNLVDLEAVVTDANNRIDVVANLLCDDGNVYHITMFYQAPEIQNYDTIVATNLKVEEISIYGYVLGYSATASDENYEVSFSLDSDQDGTYAASGSITNIATGVASKVYSGSITLATAADGTRTLTGDVLCENSTLYTLNLTYVLPEPTSEETLNGYGYLYLEQEEDMYYWGVQAMNQEGSRFIQLFAITDGNDAGVYSTSDLYASYCYAGKFVGADTAWYDMVDANITLAIEGEYAQITGTFLGQNDGDAADVTKFNITLTLQVVDERGGGNQYDAQDADFKHVFSSYEIDDQYLADYNVLVAEATDADNNIISLEFNVAAGTTELAAGTYPINATGETNTVSAGSIDQYIYGSFAGTTNAQGQINVPLWLIVEGTVTVYPQGVIGVTAVNTWGREIQCRLGEWPEAIENTEAAAAATKRIVNGNLVIEKNGVLYNAEGAVIK